MNGRRVGEAEGRRILILTAAEESLLRWHSAIVCRSDPPPLRLSGSPPLRPSD